ncbi:MAG: RuBisCO accumulation factor 1 [Cyanobacteriota bacterium]
MSEQSPSSPLSEERATELLRQLRQKEGNWVEWGKSCQELQKGGYNAQTIFEETGFEPVHQNQVIVAAQVYESLVKAGVEDQVQEHFTQKGSDILYEFRILPPKERTEVATLAVDKNLNQSEAHEVAKAVKEFSYLSRLPEGFTDTAGDAIAYHYWKLARGKKDLQARSRLIAQGLRYVASKTAREKIESLLSDFTVVPTTPAPTLPLYRLEQEEELPRIVPVAPHLKISSAQFQSYSQPQPEGQFSITKVPTETQWVAIPGWQMVWSASDPVAIPCEREELPKADTLANETFLVVVDRADTQWYLYSYFLVEEEDGLAIRWFEKAPNQTLLGKVILILRPKRIVDEGAIAQSWQVEE